MDAEVLGRRGQGLAEEAKERADVVQRTYTFKTLTHVITERIVGRLDKHFPILLHSSALHYRRRHYTALWPLLREFERSSLFIHLGGRLRSCICHDRHVLRCTILRTIEGGLGAPPTVLEGAVHQACYLFLLLAELDHLAVDGGRWPFETNRTDCWT